MKSALQRRRGGGAGSNQEASTNGLDLELSGPFASTPSNPSHSSLVGSRGNPIEAENPKRRRRRKGILSRICSPLPRPTSRATSLRSVALISTMVFLLLGGVVFVWRDATSSPFYSTSLFSLSPPRLPIPRIDVKVPNSVELPLIHIVNTRFMQEQGPLTILGMARLNLFLTFCFPTMISQSTQKFYWIIKTDPKFTTTSVFLRLIEVVRDHPNIYVVASNTNFMIHPGKDGSWRNGAEPMDLLESKIYTGNLTKLYQAMALRNERPVLETRLDADDGLHKYFIQYMQVVAMKRFRPMPRRRRKEGGKHGLAAGVKGKTQVGNDLEKGHDGFGDYEAPDTPQWLYWCTRRHLEWHSSLNDTITETEKELFGDVSLGFVVPIQHDRLCITPGMTVGYNVGVDPRDVPVHSHDHLYHAVYNSTACYPRHDRAKQTSQRRLRKEGAADNKNIEGRGKEEDDDERPPCLELVEDIIFCAIRSRTWTSAGMRDVARNSVYTIKGELIEKVWMLMEERFSINKTKVRETRKYLIDHRREIAHENILGQCTTGHSCKDQAKEELRQYMEHD